MYEYREYTRPATEEETKEMRLKHDNLLDEIDYVEQEKKIVAKSYKEKLSELREQEKELRKNVRLEVIETSEEVEAKPDYSANLMRHFTREGWEVDQLARTLTQAESQLALFPDDLPETPPYDPETEFGEPTAKPKKSRKPKLVEA